MTSNDATAVQAGDLENAAASSDIRALFAVVSRAWTDGDADAFAAGYAENATVIFPGTYLPGREAIRAAMAAAFAGPLKGSRRIHDVHAIRFPGDRTAVVISNSGTVLAGEPGAPADRSERVTWLLSRRDGRWLVEAYHSSPQNAA
ncbi:MAG TPA: SgcJ/EcaC family oxidoreductase [Trebonia sp.]|nr:SgcJ/EcaC family oxidoreductase [Trebonia sp.]